MIKQAVIMAGGRAVRLRPLSYILPKALLPIGTKPVLQIILEQLKHAGIERVILCLGYKSKMIREWCERNPCGLRISYYNERKSLGTAGALRMIYERLDQAFIVLNCDVLTDLNFRTFIKNYAEDMPTYVATIEYDVHIPYGRYMDGDLNLIDTETFEVLMGIYIINKTVVKKVIKPNTFINMPDVCRLYPMPLAIDRFQHTGYWRDVGNLNDLSEIWKSWRKANGRQGRMQEAFR